jgi:RNA polymerase sigma-70 factor (ECF subfamily)
MEPGIAKNDLETANLLHKARQGDGQALGELFTQHRARLRRMVQFRLDRRLQGRLDPSDVLQETYFELSRSLAEYESRPEIPFFLWLRLLAAKKLQALHRHHLGTQMRDAGREISLHHGPLPQASSVSLAEHLLGRLSSPSLAAMRAELQLRVQEVLNSMDPLDREVLTLRHFEQLSNSEAAAVLGITQKAASNRFVRALKRLKEILVKVPGVFEPLRSRAKP